MMVSSKWSNPGATLYRPKICIPPPPEPEPIPLPVTDCANLNPAPEFYRIKPDDADNAFCSFCSRFGIAKTLPHQNSCTWFYKAAIDESVCNSFGDEYTLRLLANKATLHVEFTAQAIAPLDYEGPLPLTGGSSIVFELTSSSTRCSNWPATIEAVPE